MDGPLVHPLGEAKVSLELKSTDPGYSTLTSSNTNGEKVGSAVVTQDIKTGVVDGQLNVSTSTRERGTDTNANPNDELAARVTTSGGNLRLKINPRLSLKAQGSVSTTRTELAGSDFTNTQATTDQEVDSRGGDVGMEWKVGKSLSVNASVGRSQIMNRRESDSADDSTWSSLPGTEENRYSLSLRHPASGLAATYSTRERPKLQMPIGSASKRCAWKLNATFSPPSKSKQSSTLPTMPKDRGAIKALSLATLPPRSCSGVRAAST